MSLTGSFLLDGIIVLTLAVFLGVVLVWPRLTRRHPLARRRASRRAGVGQRARAAHRSHPAERGVPVLRRLGRPAGCDHRAPGPDLAPPRRRREAGAERRGAGGGPGAGTGPTGQPSGLVAYTVHGAISGLTGKVLVQLPAGYTSAASTALSGARGLPRLSQMNR